MNRSIVYSVNNPKYFDEYRYPFTNGLINNDLPWKVRVGCPFTNRSIVYSALNSQNIFLCVENSPQSALQGRMKEGKSTYAFFLMLRKLMTWYGGKSYGIKCGKWVLKVRCGKWLGLCMLIIGGYFLDGKSSEFFLIYRGVAQGCTLSPTLFLIYTRGKIMFKYSLDVGMDL